MSLLDHLQDSGGARSVAARAHLDTDPTRGRLFAARAISLFRTVASLLLGYQCLQHLRFSSPVIDLIAAAEPSPRAIPAWAARLLPAWFGFGGLAGMLGILGILPRVSAAVLFAVLQVAYGALSPAVTVDDSVGCFLALLLVLMPIDRIRPYAAGSIEAGSAGPLLAPCFCMALVAFLELTLALSVSANVLMLVFVGAAMCVAPFGRWRAAASVPFGVCLLQLARGGCGWFTLSTFAAILSLYIALSCVSGTSSPGVLRVKQAMAMAIACLLGCRAAASVSASGPLVASTGALLSYVGARSPLGSPATSPQGFDLDFVSAPGARSTVRGDNPRLQEVLELLAEPKALNDGLRDGLVRRFSETHCETVDRGSGQTFGHIAIRQWGDDLARIAWFRCGEAGADPEVVPYVIGGS